MVHWTVVVTCERSSGVIISSRVYLTFWQSWRMPSTIGIFAFLDEECTMPRGSDATFHTKIFDHLGSHPHLLKAGAGKVKTEASDKNYVIKHFAGDVRSELFVHVCQRNHVVQSCSVIFWLIVTYRNAKKSTASAFWLCQKIVQNDKFVRWFQRYNHILAYALEPKVRLDPTKSKSDSNPSLNLGPETPNLNPNSSASKKRTKL